MAASQSASNATSSALLVIDMQEDFCEPKGSLAVTSGRQVVHKINELLDYPNWALKIATKDCHPKNHISFASNHKDAQPFKTQHTIKNPGNESETQTILLWPDHCVSDTFGLELIPELNVSKLDLTITKGQDQRVESYSGFGPPFRNPRVSMSDLESRLKEGDVTRVFCVGLAYDFCVKHTAIDAVEHGYESYIIENATKAVMQDEESMQNLRTELKESGVKIIGSDDESLREIRDRIK